MPDVISLGRSVVVDPGQAPPDAWAGCDRIEVAAVDAGLAEVLHRAWRERTAVAISLHPGLGLDDPATPPPERLTGLQPWEWPVDLELTGEKLHHAIWANAVDARAERPPDAVDARAGRPPAGRPQGAPAAAPTWRWADEAVRIGARPAPGGLADGADVLLPDGTPAICDGGPLQVGLTGPGGPAVLHRVGLEHRSLTPLGGGATHMAQGAAQIALAAAAHLDLAADQIAAVTEPGAAARIIAPAGSGKTRVLTERARLMVHGWRLPPGALALVAYNVRAAGEMRDRLLDVGDLRIRTLNALGLRLGGRSTTIDETEVRRVLSQLVNFPKRAETDPAAPWIEAFSRVRLGLASPEEVENELPDVSDLDRVARAYRADLAGRGVVDFDEQVVGAIERLLADPVFRMRSQRFARVLLVDEFQDLTPAHMLLIRLLSGPGGAVFAVGDDDQTIYGYAGATPRWLVDFDRWFPGAATHPLEVNYRCPPAIVTAAANLLTRNAVRVPKVIRAGRPAGDGPALVVDGPADGRPGQRTTAAVVALLAEGAAPDQIAVLSRVNAALVPVQVLLHHAGVAVNAPAERRFLQRSGVRGALAWLAVAAAPARAIPAAALREAARRPKRGMSNSLLDLLARPRRDGSFDGLVDWLTDKGSEREAGKVADFAKDVALVRGVAERGSTADILRAVRSRVGGGGLDASANALDQWSHGSVAAHLDDLDALAELAELEPDPLRFPEWLADQLAAPAQGEGVTLASIHAVKGREWPFVVLHHVTDGLVPHRLAGDPEEERRVFHVGLTRAAERVVVVAGDPPSPFLAELTAPGRPPDRRTATSPGGAGGLGGPGPSRPPGAPAGRPQPGQKDAGRRSGGAPDKAVPLLPVQVGTSFSSGGQTYEVVELTADGAACLIGGGPARSSVRFGSEVAAEGRTVILAHPRAEAAWERLRAWRADQAKEQKVPPYVVFDDRTLRAVAARLPMTETGLLAIRGIGPLKLDAYGAALVAIAEEMRDAGADRTPGNAE